MGKLKNLHDRLKNYPPRPIKDEIFFELTSVWEEEIAGWEATALYSYKLDRSEFPEWNPPAIHYF